MSTNAHKSGPYYPMYTSDFTHVCRANDLTPEQVGALVMVDNQQWELDGPVPSVDRFAAYSGFNRRTANRLLNELITAGQLIQSAAGFHNDRMARAIAKFRDRSASATAREQRKNCRVNDHSQSNSSPKLSEKLRENNGKSSTEEALLRNQNLEPSYSPPVDENLNAEFESWWAAFPSGIWKEGKATCRVLYQRVVSGASPHGTATPAELRAALQAYSTTLRKRETEFGSSKPMGPKRWLEDGLWLDSVKASEVDSIGDSTDNWWDDASKIRGYDGQGYSVAERILALCRTARSWHSELGPAPLGERRTALHDYIAANPQLLRRLERDYGIEFPSGLRDLADMAAAGNVVSFSPARSAAPERAFA